MNSEDRGSNVNSGRYQRAAGKMEKKEYKHTVVPIWRSSRGLLAIMAMVGFVFMYLLRINLSIALVCMVKEQPAVNITRPNGSLPTGWGNKTRMEEEEDGCGRLEKARRSSRLGEFEWSKLTQGYILSSFYYGYITTQIAGGWLASQVGGKHVMGTGLLISMIATLLIPVAARTHVGGMIALRVVMGMGMGVVFPSTQALIGRWAPPFERTKITAFIFAGISIGTIAAMSLSGLLCSVSFDNGWPLIFYIFGGAGILWWVAWNFTAYSSPGTHPRISEAEILYIQETVGMPATSNRRRVYVPWVSIWTSLPVWAIIVGHVCNNWGSYTILSCIPMYMREVLKFDIKQNGLLSALPYVCMYIACLLFAGLADTIRERGIMSTKTVRKVSQGIAFLGPAILIAVMGYMDCSRRMLAVALLTIAVTLTAFARCGFVVNPVDIAPRFSGVLYGISNTAATIPGMVTPTIAGALTPNGTQAEWQRVFFICSGMYTFGAIFYILFADGEEQDWAKQQDHPDANQYPATDFTEGHEETQKLSKI